MKNALTLLRSLDPVWLLETLRFDLLVHRLDQLTPAEQGRFWDDDDDDDEDDDPPYQISPEGIVTFSINGFMTKRSYWWSSGCSTSLLRDSVNQAAADPNVRGGFADIYSPGGQADGSGDLADAFAAFGKVKPLKGYIEDAGCSAAYYAVSQCTQFYCNKTATVGSVGTKMSVWDTTEAFKIAGIKPYTIASGDLKAVPADGEKITEAQLDYLRAYIAAVNAAFLDAVQTARKLSDEQMQEIGRGGLYVGQAAVDAGLVDGISTREAVMEMLKQEIASRGSYAVNFARSAYGGGKQGGKTALLEAVKSEAERTEPSAETVANPTEPAAPPPGAVSVAQEITPAEQSAPTRAASQTRGSEPLSDLPASPKPLPGKGREGKEMKEKLVKILAALGLRQMAVALVGVTDESPEALASAMAEQVGTEVRAQIEAHPLIQACQAAGITSPADVSKVMEMRALGEQYVQELKAEAKAQAIRAYGAEAGPAIGAQVENLTVHQIKLMRDSWSKQADKTYEIEEGGAKRASAPKVLNESLSAEGGGGGEDNRTPWQKLSAEQQKVGLQMGMNTPEKQNKFAEKYLEQKAQAA